MNAATVSKLACEPVGMVQVDKLGFIALFCASKATLLRVRIGEISIAKFRVRGLREEKVLLRPHIG